MSSASRGRHRETARIDCYAFCAVVRLVYPDQAISKLKHIVTQAASEPIQNKSNLSGKHVNLIRLMISYFEWEKTKHLMIMNCASLVRSLM
jgi:hypothetical protein